MWGLSNEFTINLFGDGGGYSKKSFVAELISLISLGKEIREANTLVNMLLNRIKLTNANLSHWKFSFSCTKIATILFQGA